MIVGLVAGILAILVVPLLGQISSNPSVSLGVYLADNHVRAFDYIAKQCALETPQALVLIDAHSDASRVSESDNVREGLRRVRSTQERSRRVERWLGEGVVQAFNWIEPLMPRPLDRVYWVPSETLTALDANARETEAREQVDANLDHLPRAAGSLGDRFHIVDLMRLREVDFGGFPVIATIDLDYFAGQSPDTFRDVWESVLALPGLRHVAFAVSRPWLKDDEEAHRLIELALRAVLSVDNAHITFEPFAPEGPDRSELAKGLLALGKLPPRYDLESAPESLRQLLQEYRDRFHVEHEPDRFQALLEQWCNAREGFTIRLAGAELGADGIYRVTRENAKPLRIQSPLGIIVERVSWLASEPEHDVYNVLPNMPAGKVFSGDAASGFVRRKDRLAAEIEDDDQWAAAAWTALADDRTGWGEIRLRARVGWRDKASGERGETVTPLATIRIAPDGVGPFRTALAEQFNRPYVFGAGFFSRGDLSGPEAGDGNDCANFLVAACRRAGRVVPWCNPEQLRPWLKEIQLRVRPQDFVEISSDAVETGYVVHFDNHATALWEDRPPLGKLDGGDLLAHHLGGKPGLITLGDLHKRYQRPFDLYALPDARRDAVVTIAFGGDMIFGNDGPPRVPDSIRDVLRGADFAVANLEGSPITERSPAWTQASGGFRFTPNADRVLESARELGLDAVSLANNHALDAGPAARSLGLEALKLGGLSVFGVGNDETASIVLERSGLRIGLFGVSMVEPCYKPESETIAVPRLPEDAEAVHKRLTIARGEVDTLIAFVHWGDEYTAEVNDDQRQWARWLIDLGVDAVVGAHSHYPQAMDAWRGCPIWYSLGNLFAPNQGPNEGFRRQCVLTFGLDTRGRVLGGRLVEPAP